MWKYDHSPLGFEVTEFDRAYFERHYRKKSWFGFDSGKRPFLYHFWLRKIRRLTGNADRILEVGCGLGYLLQYLEKDRPVIGVDLSMDALRIARKSTRIPLLQASAVDLPFKEGCFSVAVALDLIEHLPRPEMFLAETGRVLKKGGVFILSTPNPSSFGATAKGRKAEFKGRPDDDGILEWYGWRDSTHISIQTISNWRNLLKSHGFRILKDGTDTFWDVPYFKGIPYALQKAFFISLQWALTWAFGFFPWTWGENYICIARKVAP